MTFSYPTDDRENRVRGVVRNLVGTENADDIMEELLSVLTESGSANTGKYYTFVYAKHQIQNMMISVSWCN